MNEELRNEIIRRRQGGASLRRIARDLGLARDTVQSVIRRWEAARAGQTSATPAPTRRPSLVDPFNDFIRQLLERYPDITIARIFEELRARGFSGGMTIVRERVLELRPQPLRQPVVRFETPGAQAQMDYSTYDIDFSDEGRRRVHLFSYVLAYSRRQYLRFVEAQDLPTTLREHVRAFDHLGGVAATCLYDNMKVVVLRHDDEGPIYNPKFLAFATHYGYTPHACRIRRSQTKGKVERPFYYVETNLLNGRTFRSREHLNETTAWWLANVADVRVHRETRQRPLDRHAEERSHLLPLPAAAYDVATVVYRVVNVEGRIAYQQNDYSVPWRYIGHVLPVRISDTELIVYGPHVEEVARHRLLPRTLTGQHSEDPAHRPNTDPRQHEVLLRERFSELGPNALRFFDGLLQTQRCGKAQAGKVLAPPTPRWPRADAAPAAPSRPPLQGPRHRQFQPRTGLSRRLPVAVAASGLPRAAAPSSPRPLGQGLEDSTTKARSDIARQHSLVLGVVVGLIAVRVFCRIGRLPDCRLPRKTLAGDPAAG